MHKTKTLSRYTDVVNLKRREGVISIKLIIVVSLIIVSQRGMGLGKEITRISESVLMVHCYLWCHNSLSITCIL